VEAETRQIQTIRLAEKLINRWNSSHRLLMDSLSLEI